MSRRDKPRLNASTTLLQLLGIEAVLVAVAVVIVLTVTMKQAPALVDKARAVGDLHAIRPAQVDMTEWIAERGELPPRPEPLLGTRPALHGAEAAAPVLWLCGDRRPPAHFETLPALPSAAASAARFSICRERRSS